MDGHTREEQEPYQKECDNNAQVCERERARLYDNMSKPLFSLHPVVCTLIHHIMCMGCMPDLLMAPPPDYRVFYVN